MYHSFSLDRRDFPRGDGEVRYPGGSVLLLSPDGENGLHILSWRVMCIVENHVNDFATTMCVPKLFGREDHFVVLL